MPTPSFEQVRRRFRPGVDPHLAARAEQQHAAALRAGALDPSGRHLNAGSHGGAQPRRRAPAAGKNGLQDVSLPNPDGMHLGGRFFEPGRSVQLQLDPSTGTFLHGGEKILLGMGTADVHDPTELGTFLAGFSAEEFRHPEMCQIVPSDFDEAKYRIFDSGVAFKPIKVKTNDEAKPGELRVSTSLTPYKVQPRRIAAFLPDKVKAQAGSNYDVRFVLMGRCSRVINMDLEIDVSGAAGLLTSAAAWNAFQVNALIPGYQWGGPSGIGGFSDPVADLRLMIESSAQRINGFWFNQRGAGIFLDHPKVRDYTRGKMGDAALDASIKAVQDMDQEVIDFKIAGLGTFHVTTSRIESNAAGTQTDYIFPAVCVGLTQPPGVPTNGEKIATSYNWRLNGPAGVGFYTREYRVEDRGAGGTMIVVEEASIPTMVGNSCGGLITGIYQ